MTRLGLWNPRIPWLLLTSAGLLVLLGLAGIARADELAETGGRFFERQLVWLVISAAIVAATAATPYRAAIRWGYAFYLGCLVLLVLVFAWPPVNGAQRWLRLGPLSLQPSELAKVALVIVLAGHLMRGRNGGFFSGVVAPLGLAGLPAILILREPDLGTAVLFPAVAAGMAMVAGGRWTHWGVVLCVGLLCLPLVWSHMSREQRSRVTVLFDQTPPGERPSDDDYQLHQSKQMFALGGWWGSRLSGDALADRGVYHLPESHSDFVLAIIAERFGLWGAATVLLLFAVLTRQAVQIALWADDPCGRLLAAGVAMLFGLQAVTNVGMTVGLLPVSGLSLPLVSYGGSGLAAHLAAVGLLVSIALRPGYELAPHAWRPTLNSQTRSWDCSRQSPDRRSRC